MFCWEKVLVYFWIPYDLVQHQMRGFVLVLVSVLALHSCSALKNLDEPRWKSFREAELECAEYLFITNETLERYRSRGYPDEPSTRKLINCILINLNAWDESLNQIKDYTFKQFFIPNTVDCLYVQHTQECLDQTVAPLDPYDRLGRAYKSFQCYYLYYSGISDEVKWVPFYPSEIVDIIGQCLRIVPQTNESLVQYCQGKFADNSDYPPAAYCFTVRAGFYNKTTGIDLEKLFVQYGGGPSGTDLFEADTVACIRDVYEQYCKEPDRLVHTVVDCLLYFLPVVRDISAGASSVLGNPPECIPPPSPPRKTQPCYNDVCQ